MKKSAILLLCVLLVVVFCAVSITLGKRARTKYEQPFYELHEAGQKTSAQCDFNAFMSSSYGDSASYDLSLSTTDHTCTFVLQSTSEINGLEMGGKTLDVQFTTTTYEYFKGTYEVSEDGTIYTCNFTEKRMAMDLSEEFTSILRLQYLASLRVMMLADSSQAQYYRATKDMLEGKITEDPDFERVECVLRKEGESNRLVSISNYQDGVCNEKTEFREDTILRYYHYNSDEESRITEYDYSGIMLSITRSDSISVDRTEYYPNGDVKAEISMTSDGFLCSDYRYDENGNPTYCYFADSDDHTSLTEIYEDGFIIQKTEINYETGQIRYDIQYYPVLLPGTYEYVRKSEVQYDEDGTLIYSYECPDSSAPETYTMFYLYDDKTSYTASFQDGILIRETYCYANGQISSDQQYHLDTDEPVVKKSVSYDEDGTLIYSYECPDSAAPDTFTTYWVNDDKTSCTESWQDGRLIHETYYYANGQIQFDHQWYPALSPDKDELIQKSYVAYDEDGTLIYSYECPDSSAPDTFTDCQRSDYEDGSYIFTENEYRNGNCIHTTYYDANWKKTSYNEYDEYGNVTECYFYDGYGHVIGWIEYGYHLNGTMASYIEYDASGNVIAYYKYDENGDFVN